MSAVLAVIAAFIGSGAAGGQPVQDAAGGALAADATLVAPGAGAFSIWSLIYLGLLAYAVWQFLPAQRTAVRHRRLGYPIATSLLLNGAWILSVQFDRLGLSVPIIMALLVVLVVAFRTCLALPPRNVLDMILTDGTVGLYLGWVDLATAANIAAVLAASGWDGWGIRPDVGRPRRGARRARGNRARGVGPRAHRAHAVARVGPRLDRRRPPHGCPGVDRRGHHRDHRGGRDRLVTVAVRIAVVIRHRHAEEARAERRPLSARIASPPT